MNKNPKATDQITDLVQIRLVHLKATEAGIVAGTLMAIGLFLGTNWLVLKGGPNVGQHLELIGQYFIGYSVSFVGSLIGAAYAFVLAFLSGYFVARLYNALAGRRDKH